MPLMGLGNNDVIRKLTLNDRPDSIEELKTQLRDKLSLQYDFKLQYEDPDFSNALCNLTDITDLPARATLKVIPLVTLEFAYLSSPTEESDCSTVDAEILSPAESSPSLRKQWPQVFALPNFSVDVEYRLRQADLSFMKDRIPITPSRDMKHDILEKLAETMYSFKAYPNDDDFSSVAKSLISKHPSLTEPGPQPGWYGWKNSIKFKMANYRTKLRKAGCDDVMINGGKQSKLNPDGESSRKNVKRPKRGEANYLPNLPDGHDERSLENARKIVIEEMKKKKNNATLVSQMMDQTFPLRRREIVTQEPVVKSLVERWPALFTERQVFAEFNCVASKNLEGDFYEALDQHTPRFIELFKSKKGTTGQKLTDLMQHINCLSQAFLFCLVMTPDTAKEEALASVTVGVLTVVNEDAQQQGLNAVHLQPISTAIILEGSTVMDNVRDFPQAVCLLFGLMYALHLDYPKCMANTLRFIQAVMLGLGSKTLPPKLLSLKNKLLG
ncbi:Sterile alpha motif domain-containing protein 3 [Merluccius polli]|uniref:Sterile alpha motif domain-containing protein 3 n=1 Tax=Merluccius polli TaxID=89951 RepID=A0AA47NUK3_MERPO|nr:Sterile alpha motif domain-containing protein 3 [Merluccius polli]